MCVLLFVTTIETNVTILCRNKRGSLCSKILLPLVYQAASWLELRWSSALKQFKQLQFRPSTFAIFSFILYNLKAGSGLCILSILIKLQSRCRRGETSDGLDYDSCLQSVFLRQLIQHGQFSFAQMLVIFSLLVTTQIISA